MNVGRVKTEVQSGKSLAYKPLRQKRGFFIRLMRTYPCITPFLKGFHLTLDGWPLGLCEDGWKGGDQVVEDGYWDEAKES